MFHLISYWWKYNHPVFPFCYLSLLCSSSSSEMMMMIKRRTTRRRSRKRKIYRKLEELKLLLLWLKARCMSTSLLPWLAVVLSEVEPPQEAVLVLAATTATWTSLHLLGSDLWSACWAAPSGSARAPLRLHLPHHESPPLQRSREARGRMEVRGGHLHWKQLQIPSPPLIPHTPILLWISLRSQSSRLTVRACHLYLSPDVTAKAALSDTRRGRKRPGPRLKVRPLCLSLFSLFIGLFNSNRVHSWTILYTIASLHIQSWSNTSINLEECGCQIFVLFLALVWSSPTPLK